MLNVGHNVLETRVKYTNDDNKHVCPTWAVGALFRGVRRIPTAVGYLDCGYFARTDGARSYSPHLHGVTTSEQRQHERQKEGAVLHTSGVGVMMSLGGHHADEANLQR